MQDISKNQLIIGGALALSVVLVLAWAALSTVVRQAQLNGIKENVEATMQHVSLPQRESLAKGEEFTSYGLGHALGKKVLTQYSDDPTLSMHFQLEAAEVDEDRYQIRAWPKASSIRSRKVSPQMFYIEFDREGKVLARGWAP